MKLILWRTWRYLIYLIKAKNAHGIHSPFVYQLLTEVIYNQTSYYIYGPAENYRESLKFNKDKIEVDDFGAGSKFNRVKTRKISSIARHSLKSKKYAQLIFRLAEKNKAKHIVELGTSLGLTTLYFSFACPEGKVTSIEGDTSLVKYAQSLISKFKRKNVTILNGKFQDLIPGIISEIPYPDFVFFDGHHDEQATLQYFEQFVKKSTENTLFIIDDIHWSTGMNRAWEKIRAHEKVTLTLDLFEFGLVYFMPRKQKEHFTIRF